MPLGSTGGRGVLCGGVGRAIIGGCGATGGRDIAPEAGIGSCCEGPGAGTSGRAISGGTGLRGPGTAGTPVIDGGRPPGAPAIRGGIVAAPARPGAGAGLATIPGGTAPGDPICPSIPCTDMGWAACGGTATRGISVGVSWGGAAGRTPCAPCGDSDAGALVIPLPPSTGGLEPTPATIGISSRTFPSARVSSASTGSEAGASRGGAARRPPAPCTPRVGSIAASCGGAELAGGGVLKPVTSASASPLRCWPGARPPNIPSVPSAGRTGGAAGARGALACAACEAAAWAGRFEGSNRTYRASGRVP